MIERRHLRELTKWESLADKDGMAPTGQVQII
jgi:hypothetical protein